MLYAVCIVIGWTLGVLPFVWLEYKKGSMERKEPSEDMPPRMAKQYANLLNYIGSEAGQMEIND